MFVSHKGYNIANSILFSVFTANATGYVYDKENALRI